MDTKTICRQLAALENPHTDTTDYLGKLNDIISQYSYRISIPSDGSMDIYHVEAVADVDRHCFQHRPGPQIGRYIQSGSNGPCDIS